MSDLWRPLKEDIAVSKVDGLDEEEQATFDELVRVWSQKLTRNKKRVEYYDQKNLLKDLGIAIPPQLRNLNAVVGWPAKAVDVLAARARFDGFTFQEKPKDDSLSALVKDTDFKQSYKEAQASELIHSCAFISMTKGTAGEPDVIIMPHSAIDAAALWDFRRRRIKAGLTIIDIDRKTNQPVALNLFTDTAVVEIEYKNSSWTATRKEHSQGRPLMEPLRYRPSIDRPFGKSRINRAVMSITDNAVREVLRTEVGAEFFTAPQRYILGAEEEAFEKSRWEQYITSVALFSRDPDGELPKYGQLTQMTMQPHMEYMRELAAQFSGETSIPISSLGVIHDNPSSAEAIHASREDLIIEAEDLNETNGISLRNIGLLALAIMQNKTVFELTDNEKTLMPKFKNPAKPSVVSQSDAIVKQASAIPWIAETTVALEELGYTEEKITRMMSDKRKADGRKTLDEIFARARGSANGNV